MKKVWLQSELGGRLFNVAMLVLVLDDVCTTNLRPSVRYSATVIRHLKECYPQFMKFQFRIERRCQSPVSLKEEVAAVELLSLARSRFTRISSMTDEDLDIIPSP